MKRYDLNSTFLKSLFGLEDWISEEALERVGDFLEIREAKRKTIIRHAGSVETESGFLVDGIIGMYFSGNLTRLYFPGEVFLDYESYRTQVPSMYGLRAMGECVYISLSFLNEEQLLREIPEFKDFSKFQIAKVRHADFEWNSFTQMNYRDKIRIIEEKFPSFKYDLTNAEKASLLGVSYATAARIKKIPDRKKTGKESVQLEKLLSYPFPAYVHQEAAEIEGLTASWAYHFHGIFRNIEEMDYYKRQKFSYLSSCLYPEIDFERGLWISKLYLWLFYLDDLTDSLPSGQKALLWDYLIKGVQLIADGKIPGFNPSRISVFLNAFFDLTREFSELVADNEELLKVVLGEIILYLKENKREAEYKDNGRLPSLEEYQTSRPYFSGGNLALALCSFESGEKFRHDCPDWKGTEQLRLLGAKLIHLSNDLISYAKEASQGDFMNAVALLMHHKKMDFSTARQEVLNQHSETLEEFMRLEANWRDKFRPENNGILKYLKQVKYKIAGSVHWSLSISPRYRMH